MTRFILGFLCSSAFVVFVIGCNDAPSEVGSILAQDTTSSRSISSADTIILTKSETYLSRDIVQNNGILYVGKTPTATAITLIRLTNIPDTLFTLSEKDIDSATMLIRPRRYVIGDSLTNTLSFNVVKMVKAWIISDSVSSFKVQPRWTDLYSSGGVPNPVYFSPTPIASFTGQIPLKDTLVDFSIPLNAEGKKLLAEWFLLNKDSASRTQIYGLGLLPNATSTVIRALSTHGTGDVTGPLLRVKVYYKNSIGVRDSLQLESGNDYSFVDAEKLDSLRLQSQPAVSYEGRIYFDVSGIPSLDAILNAKLTVTVDTTKYVLGNNGEPSRVLISYIDSSTNTAVGYTATRTAGSTQLVFPNVSQVLDYAKRYRNGKGYFGITSNAANLERIAVYGLSADSALRPKLTVTYISRPNLGVKK